MDRADVWCVFNGDVLLTVPKSRLVRRITRLGAARMDEVHRALRYSLELP